MTVVEMNRFRENPSENLFRRLLVKGRDIDGVALTLRRKDGTEETFFTGLYEASPEKALSASMRLSWKLTQILDDEPL